MSDTNFLKGMRPFASERLTVSTTAVGGTTATIDQSGTVGDYSAGRGTFKAQAAFVECLSNGVVYTVDGSTPSGTNGHSLAAGDATVLFGYQSVKNFLAVRAGASDAAVNITYYY